MVVILALGTLWGMLLHQARPITVQIGGKTGEFARYAIGAVGVTPVAALIYDDLRKNCRHSIGTFLVSWISAFVSVGLGVALATLADYGEE